MRPQVSTVYTTRFCLFTWTINPHFKIHPLILLKGPILPPSLKFPLGKISTVKCEDILGAGSAAVHLKPFESKLTEELCVFGV